MQNLTWKELTLLEDSLSAEELLIAKFKKYAAEASDPQIRTKCEQIAAQHQSHYNRLLQQLN